MNISVMIDEYSEDGKILYCASHKDEKDFDIHVDTETLEVSIHTNDNFNIEELSEFNNDTFKYHLLRELIKARLKDDDIIDNVISVNI